MRIAFIASTREKGKDGIGDYTRRLAGFCRDHGHECEIFPFGKWNLPMGLPEYRDSVARLRGGLEDYHPDVISWQYDGNLFSPRRIFPLFPIPDFSRIAPFIHLMVHETWEGAYADAPFRKIVKGRLQRHSAAGFVEKVRPRLVHTSIALYQHMLSGIGVHATPLPMISNIPRDKEVELRNDFDSPEWHFVFFGGVYDPAGYDALLKITGESGRKCVFHHAGRLLDRSNWDRFRTACGGRFQCIEHGELDARSVSALLGGCHFGVSTVPKVILGKSTVYCVFREHGLPVVNLRGPQFYPGFTGHENEQFGNLIDLDSLAAELPRLRRHEPVNSLELTGRQFLGDLSLAAAAG